MTREDESAGKNSGMEVSPEEEQRRDREQRSLASAAPRSEKQNEDREQEEREDLGAREQAKVEEEEATADGQPGRRRPRALLPRRENESARRCRRHRAHQDENRRRSTGQF